MNASDDWGFETRAIHSGFEMDTTGAVMPPIHPSSTFAQLAPGEPFGDYEYSRTKNPTRTVLEANLAALEGARYGLSFASGCSALTTLLHLCSSGDHVLVCDDMYGGSVRLFRDVFQKLNISYTAVDMTDPNCVITAVQPNTRFIWLETPTNPMLKIIDIATIASLRNVHHSSVILAVDNTFATPYLQNPLALGADIVAHSTTKYIGGHSDLVGGALLCNRDDLYEQLQYLQNAMGAVPSPFDCYLQLRSTKTLGVRMARHSEHALALAEFLEVHPVVERVIYPGLPSHPQHALAERQMSGGFGGMISVVLKCAPSQVVLFLQSLMVFTLAESLGGVESLVEHPATMTHATVTPEIRAELGISDTLVRLSVGLETLADLKKDLAGSLSMIA